MRIPEDDVIRDMLRNYEYDDEKGWQSSERG